MARGAPRICTYPGCNSLVAKGRCNKHPAKVSQRQDDRARNRERRARPDNNDAFYSRAHWRRVRAMKLKQDPECEHCKLRGIVTMASHVDHIVPIRQGGDAYDMANLQSLCKPCHTIKTNRERVSA